MSVSFSVSNVSSTGKSIESSIEGYGSFATRTRYLVFNLFFLVNKETQGRAVRLRNALFILELFQFFTFVLGTPGITDWGRDTSSPFSYISYIRIFALLSFNDHSAVFWCLFVYLFLYVLLGVELAYNSDAASTKRFKVFAILSSVVGPIFYLPFLNITLGYLNCSSSGETTRFHGEAISCLQPSFLVGAVFAAIMAIALIGTTIICTFLIRDFHYNKRQLFCRTDSRLLVLFLVAKTLLTFAQEYLGHLSPRLHVGVYNWTGIAISFLLFAYCIFFLPFYKKISNYIFCGFTSASFLGFLCGFASSVVNENGARSTSVLIVFLVMLVPFVGVSLLLGGFFRIQKLYSWKYSPISSITRAFEAEICSRCVRQAEVIDEDQVLNTFTLGIDLFPDDAYLKSCYALYLLERNNDFALLTLILDRIRSSPRLQIDVKFLVFCLEKERLNIALAQDGGAEEIQAKLQAVKKHSNRAKMWMKRFWDMLLKEEDLQSLPDVVANMDTEENKAEAILTKLREKFPRNVAILRHYAVFLERVKHDPDSAQLVLRLADDMEEEKTTKHRNKRNKKDKDLKLIEIKAANQSSANLAAGSGATVRFSDRGTLGGDDEEPSHPNSISESYSTKELPTSLSEGSGYAAMRKQELTNTGDDGASTVSGSSISFTHLKSMKRADVLRFRKYKYLTENSRSKALGKLTIAINVTLLLLLVNIIAVFATTKFMISTFGDSIGDVQGASLAKIDLHEGALETQMLRLSVLQQDAEGIALHKQNIIDVMEHLEETVTVLFSDNNNYKKLDNGWKAPIYNMSEWYLSTQTEGWILKNLWDALAEFIWRSRELTVASDQELLAINQSLPLRFVLDNAPVSIYRALSDLVSLYQERNNSVAVQLTLVVSVLIPITFLILVLLGVLLLYPSVKEIKLERAATLRLFLSVPKSCISSIVGKLRSEEEAAGDDMISEVSEVSNLELKEEFVLSSAQAVPVLRSFVVKYLVSLVLVFAAICVIAFTALFSLTTITNNVAEIAAATEQRVLATRLQFDAFGLLFSPYDKFYSEPYRHRILEDCNNLDMLDFYLRFGNKSMGLPGKFNQEPFLMEINFGRSCPSLLKFNMTCTGYVSLLDLMIDGYTALAHIPNEQLDPNLPELKQLIEIDYNYLDTWSMELDEFFMERSRGLLHRIDVIVIILFVLLLPTLVIILFVLRPIVKRIRLESTRTVKMMLMVPFEVIDSLHPVRDFLNTGQHVFANQKKNANSIDSANDDLMRIVFMQSDRAITVTSPMGEIDVFNPLAESLFGYSKKEVLGNNFSLLLPDAATISTYNAALANLRKVEDGLEKREEIEILGRHKSHQVIPLKLTLVQAKVTGKLYVVHYMEDLVRVRNLEANVASQAKAFDIEQCKMKNFMYNMFPHSIAEQLIAQKDNNNTTIMAEEYKEVTILFADIVGFTNMCSHLEPAALLVILNGIFLKWDALVDKYGLQKIKTIGDCYMVAGGLPERTIDHTEKMLDFAMEMIEALNIYNRSNEFLLTRGLALSLRVGINTGPVVAGIIGHSRICFDLWGDAVNVASRMESTSLEGRIQVSPSTHSHSKNNYEYEERGTVDVKGKGAMLTYLLVGKRFQETPGGTMRDMRFQKHAVPTMNPLSLTPQISSVPAPPSTTPIIPAPFALSPSSTPQMNPITKKSQ